MKPINTFEDALKQVAENHRAKTFGNLIFWETGDPYWQEAAELYAEAKARKAANEAVEKDREDLNKVCESTGLYISRTIRNRPLPFPEES
jgi:hypothetical protein